MPVGGEIHRGRLGFVPRRNGQAKGKGQQCKEGVLHSPCSTPTPPAGNAEKMTAKDFLFGFALGEYPIQTLVGEIICLGKGNAVMLAVRY